MGLFPQNSPLKDGYSEMTQSIKRHVQSPRTPSEHFFHWLRWYVSGRTFEWFCATNMVAQGLLVFFFPIAVEKSAFKYLALPWEALFGILTVFGTLRIIALFVNGRSTEWGPRARIAGALLGSFIWAQMTIALFTLSLDTGYPSAGIPNWGLLTMWELAAAYQAGTDIRGRNPKAA